MLHSLKSATWRGWKALYCFVLFLAEVLNGAGQGGKWFYFFCLSSRKDMIIDDMVNCFQIFEKVHEFLSRDMHRMGAHTDLSCALWAEGPSALDQC